MIPRRLIRTVPAQTTAEVDAWWRTALELHPGWSVLDLRDPLDPAQFPLTGAAWPDCRNGAQKADLIRLEAVYAHGGIYLDSDVELYRPLDPLLACRAFAAWQDKDWVPNAVFGAEAAHPAIAELLQAALATLKTARGTIATGPRVFTQILPGRDDTLLLPPGSFYPYHHTQARDARARDHRAEQPWCFGAHHWQGSWLPPELRAGNR